MELKVKKVRDGYKVTRNGKLIPGQMPYPTPAGAQSAIKILMKRDRGLGVTGPRRPRRTVRTRRSAHFKRRDPDAARVRDVSTESLKFAITPLVTIGDRGRRCFEAYVTTADDLNIGSVEACTWRGFVDPLEERGRTRFDPTRNPDGVNDIKISSSGVDHNFQGRGIGTRLYEMVLKEACVRGYDGLQSDRSLSRFSGSFWRKQHAKGRADLMEDEDGEKLFRIDCEDRPDQLDSIIPLGQAGESTSKIQAVRLADVFLIGPAMIAAGTMDKLPKELRAFAIWIGISTIAFNGANYFRFREEDGLL